MKRCNNIKQLPGSLVKVFSGVAFVCLSLSSAYAGGDIGGNCCADLEERVAELEATTARKGNRKVSLKVSGHVNRMVLHWDDQVESDTYVVDNSNSSSRFRFTGNAKIRSGWSAGYYVEMEYDTAASTAVTQSDDDAGGTNGAIDLRHSYWWIKSDQLGKISVGQGPHASWLTTAMDTSGTHMIANTNKLFTGGSLQFRNATGTGLSGISILSVVNPYDLVRGDIIRYDSPSIHGFKISASWGEDDASDIALRYFRKTKEFKLLFALGYGGSNDENADFDQIAGSFSAFHIPTGINISFAAGDRNTDGSTLDQKYYYLKAGLRRKINSLGDTAFSFDYYHHHEHAAAGGDFDQWGVQAVQYIDAAAMELYIAYSNSDYETTALPNLREIDMIMAGARIHF